MKSRISPVWDFLHDDIIYIVNVDGMQVPYAMSGLGKADVQDRLQLVLETFVVTKFDVENIVHEDECSRSLVHLPRQTRCRVEDKAT